jgi:tyrosine ammonia-lyase
VGASGDLTPLAHVALCLQGRAPFQDRGGAAVPAGHVFAALGLPPLDMSQRDGLALVNGTSAMTGLAVLNQHGFARAAAWQLVLTAGIAELLSARAEAWDDALCDARPHPGQRVAAAALRRLTRAAPRIARGFIADRRLAAGSMTTEATAGQDAYTLRAAPQIVGACLDTAAWHAQMTETELNAATDNPIFPTDHPSPALHGGNFMGCHVALASDALAGAVVVLAGHAERLIARVTDERLNGGLPPFLHRGEAGLNSGLMGAQVTATALLAEMRARGGAAAVQSISTNGANQDVVSMGTIAARIARTQLGQLAHIHAIAALCVAQGRDILAAGGAALSADADALAERVRAVSPPLAQDRPLGAEITALAAAIWDRDPPGLAALHPLPRLS